MIPLDRLEPEAMDLGFDLMNESSVPPLYEEPTGLDPLLSPVDDEGPIVLQGRDLERFTFRLEQALSRARTQMHEIHEQAREDRAAYLTLERLQEYAGQPNVTTPISANKTDGLLAQMIDAMEQTPVASFKPEGVGKPAERAAQVAPLHAAYLEREINRGGSRERLIRGLQKEAGQVGTGIGRLAFVQHPSGEWFAQISSLIPIETFFVDRVAVPNLKHVFCAYQERRPFYQLEEMADSGLIDRENLELLRQSHSEEYIRTASEEEADFLESSQTYQEETAIHTIYTCYMRYRPAGAASAQTYEAIWSDQWKIPLAVRLNPVRHAYDHPPITLHRIGKESKYLFGRGVVRRLASIQQMADNAINSHLALNNLAASPPFVYRQHSPFGRLLESKRRIMPGIGIPSLGAPDQGDVQTLDIRNPGLSINDVNIAQTFADRATYTEEAIGSTSDRKTLGQFRVEMQRGTMRVRLDLGDIAYDASQTLTMMWAMMVKYKVQPAGIVEVGENGRFLAAREIDEEEINQVMDSIVMPMFAQGEMTADDLAEIEEEFNARLTEGVVPSARRSDLSIHLTGTKSIADKATEYEMLKELTPLMLEGLQLARQDSFWNYHLRTIIEAMGFKDVEKRIPPDPGQTVQDDVKRQELAAPLAQSINRSSNFV